MPTQRKLKISEIADFRSQLLLQQGGVCALCQEPIEPGRAVLDHDHKSGQIRGVLHRGCNSFEGQLVNSLPRNLITPQRLGKILENLIAYQKALRAELHPTYKTQEQRRQRAKTRARAKKKK